MQCSSNNSTFSEFKPKTQYIRLLPIGQFSECDEKMKDYEHNPYSMLFSFSTYFDEACILRVSMNGSLAEVIVNSLFGSVGWIAY